MTPTFLQRSRPAVLPPSVGIGLKPQHYEALLGPDSPSGKPAWVEVHPQNYFGDGGPPHRWLTAIAEPLSVKFSFGGVIVGVCRRFEPA